MQLHRSPLAGFTFEHTIIAAYTWLSNNYVEGDRIFLFGFSRGAYQVRILAGMIATLGLVFPNNDSQVSIAYELYIKLRTRPSEDVNNHVPFFKETFSRKETHVHFLGAWDTVPEVELIPPGFVTPPEINLSDDVTEICFFHERQVTFLPHYVTTTDSESNRDYPRVKEVWFPGTHRDLGLGKDLSSSDSDNSFGDIPFHWMCTEARRSGLVLDLHPIAPPTLKGNLVPNSTLPFVSWVRELKPVEQPTHKYNNKVSFWPRCHLGRPRVVIPGQMIHSSVYSRALRDSGYVPRPKIPADVKQKVESEE
ncbi:hypothetical protein BDP27DRAFT_1396765 [Rhodocollybia butyracea]|uniref:T6SS Phospholipase effector Tle1-like catalytic domain-containing protein n=1 Tax=Rhodocollybia butyracea TaxID=206335 RepID=A0A9P5QAH7_9AGAR|nr:hypothetical protein BDP27DRAFT_1396765 [Rhodocollybia butyracea]